MVVFSVTEGSCTKDDVRLGWVDLVWSGLVKFDYIRLG